jgi:hypothetical protein
VAGSFDGAKSILGSFPWVERLGTNTSSRANMGSFKITA